MRTDQGLDSSNASQWVNALEERDIDIVMASHEGRALGCAALTLKGSGPIPEEVIKELGKVPFGFGLYVAPEARRQGVAARLVEARESLIVERNLGTIMAVTIDKDNTASMSLYEKLGYNSRKVNGKDTLRGTDHNDPEDMTIRPIKLVPREGDHLLMVKDLRKAV